MAGAPRRRLTLLLRVRSVLNRAKPQRVALAVTGLALTAVVLLAVGMLGSPRAELSATGGRAGGREQQVENGADRPDGDVATSVASGEDAEAKATAPSGRDRQVPGAFSREPPTVKLRCEKEFPHDPEVFTQGLEMLDSRTVLESGGLYGRSHVRVWDLASGRVLRRRDNAASHFGEGVTVFNNTVYQLTWMERVVNLFDPMDLAPRGSLQLPRKLREGWGLAHTEDALVMSDGSERLHFLDPLSLVQRRSVLVRAWRLANSAKKQQKKKQVKAASDAPELIGVPRLNELEVIDGYIYANIWHSPLIAVVSPETGIVQQWLDCSELLESGAAAYAKNPEAVLNGIAFDAASRRIFVTGKLWPAVLQCELPPLE